MEWDMPGFPEITKEPAQAQALPKCAGACSDSALLTWPGKNGRHPVAFPCLLLFRLKRSQWEPWCALVKGCTAAVNGYTREVEPCNPQQHPLPRDLRQRSVRAP